MRPSVPEPHETSVRDLVAFRLLNWTLNWIATPWYRDWITGAMHYGLSAVARDEEEGREPPPLWRERL